MTMTIIISNPVANLCAYRRGRRCLQRGRRCPHFLSHSTTVRAARGSPACWLPDRAGRSQRRGSGVWPRRTRSPCTQGRWQRCGRRGPPRSGPRTLSSAGSERHRQAPPAAASFPFYLTLFSPKKSMMDGWLGSGWVVTKPRERRWMLVFLFSAFCIPSVQCIHHTAPEGEAGLIWVTCENSGGKWTYDENASKKCEN